MFLLLKCARWPTISKSKHIDDAFQYYLDSHSMHPQHFEIALPKKIRTYVTRSKTLNPKN